ncbi:MAG: pyruvate formate lyase family protein [Desulfobacterales bacterium]|nr:pyruvate formate lyase family protein [Desulfobacterales bacterium]
MFQSPLSENRPSPGLSPTHILVKVLLKIMAACFNLRPSLRKSLESDTGWIDYSAAIKTRSGSVSACIRFSLGRASVTGTAPADADICLVFKSDRQVRRFLTASPTEQIYMILKNDFYTRGNAACLNLFVYCISLLLNKQQVKMMARERLKDRKQVLKSSPGPGTGLSEALKARAEERLTGNREDPGVRYLEDPYLPEFSLQDFPRLAGFLDSHFETRAEVCPELPELMTEWHRKNGYETDPGGKAWNPVLRKGHCYKYIMENRRPFIHANDLIAGTTTTKEVGVVVYPEGHGTMIWGELFTVPHRSLNPYDVSPGTREILHHKVFPYWANRNFKEWVREKYDNPLCQQIDERFAVYFDWKSVTISHTIPDFPKILRLGTRGIIAEIEDEMRGDTDEDRTATRQAMILCLEGLETYSRNLAAQASGEISGTKDPARRAELENLSRICTRVVSGPASTLEEAVNAIWITWVGVHMESTNAGMSLGRLDQWLQPYFIRDMEKISDPEGQKRYIRHAVELIGCFMMRCTDHLPLTPDFANYYFGGSSSDQAITLGGVTPEGDDGINDMTYIFLKVTEMLGLRDPNVNARFTPGKNSDTYLKRLCEVNLITTATPSIHNDRAIWRSLEQYNYAMEDLRNWSATGCVEPTLSGRHMGHTNFQMISLVAALEMALNNGRHPLMDWELGPRTGQVEEGAFSSFDRFFKAFEDQMRFLIDQSIRYNELLAEAHQELRPTPLLSTLISDCIKTGKDVTRGGARYNSSGAACIGLADITDSMLVIKKLVFDDRAVTFRELKEAIDGNFEKNPGLHAMVTRKVPLFGSGDPGAVAMANRITRFVHGTYNSYTNYRGGKYTAGFWSMSNHVAYGTLCGALPSGRLKGKPFTPGLTPQPGASDSLLDNLRDVAALEPENMSNNIAFNVKVVPAADESRERTVENMAAYVASYFQLGGMQMQMNVVTSDMLRDAMAHPENYRNLLVRISGYNAYFVTLNRDMQRELIERAEYRI